MSSFVLAQWFGWLSPINRFKVSRILINQLINQWIRFVS